MTPPQHSAAVSLVAPSPSPAASVSAGPEPSVVAELKRRLRGASAASFDVQMPDHRVYRVGSEPPSFTLRLRTPAALAALDSFDEFAVASAYMNGAIDFDGDFLAALDLRKAMTDFHPLHSLWRHLRPMLFGQVDTDKLWVQQHYDYGNDFYFAFLDKRVKLYSQALYRSDEQSLEDAAEQKLEYVFRACRLAPGSHVLDIGAGWGSFAGYASARGVDVTMLTISKEQHEHQKGLVAANAAPGSLETVFESIFAYDSPRKYDAIVLLGVMEHLPDYKRLFAVLEGLLKPGGRLYMDFASNRIKFNVSSFTYRYIFPGSHTPVVIPDLLAAANRTAFETVSLHNDRHSYFLTLQAWGRNLEARRDALIPKYGERTFRLFQLYLWGCARQFQKDGELESYRIVFQKGYGAPSAEIGLKH